MGPLLSLKASGLATVEETASLFLGQRPLRGQSLFWECQRTRALCLCLGIRHRHEGVLSTAALRRHSHRLHVLLELEHGARHLWGRWALPKKNPLPGILCLFLVRLVGLHLAEVELRTMREKCVGIKAANSLSALPDT